MSKIAFIGTRKGLTARQLKIMEGILLTEHAREGHYADSYPSAEDFDRVCNRHKIRTVMHIPPMSEDERAFLFANKYLNYIDDKSCLRGLVELTDELIACPAEADEQNHSVVWNVVRYARKHKKRLHIVTP